MDTTDDALFGLAGNDWLYGGAGDDELDGGAGDDMLDGGAGNDTYIIHSDGGHDAILTGYNGTGHVDTVFFADVDLQSLQCSYLYGDMVLTWGNGNKLTLSQQFHAGDGALHFRIKPTAGAADYHTYTPSEFREQLLINAADFYAGNEASEHVQAGPADASLYMQGGDDTAAGGDGNDIVYGGDGNDQLFGHAGNDGLFGDEGKDLLHGGAGNDWLEGGLGDDELQGGADDDTLFGGAGNDVLDGGAGHNQLDGGSGNDTYLIRSDGGDTVIVAASSGDVETIVFTDIDLQSLHCSGDSYSMVLSWGNGNRLTMSMQIEPGITTTIRIKPQAGAADYQTYTKAEFIEQLLIHPGASFNGSPLSEHVQGEAADDVYYMGEGNDHAAGGAGNDILDGGSGNDSLRGEAGDDGLDGGDGNDILDGGSGLNFLNGGAGDDIFVVRSDGGQHVIGGSSKQPGESDTLLFQDVALDALTMGIEAGQPTFTWGNGNKVSITQIGDASPAIDAFSIKLSAGDAGPATLSYEQLLAHKAFQLDDTGGAVFFSSLSERVYGGSGTDGLDMGDGDNWADAGAGDDYINGGSGNDTFLGGSGGDSLSGAGGNDVLDGGSGDDGLSGGEGNDVLSGGAGNDNLAGGDGNDVLDGGAGDDTLSLGGGSNTVRLRAGDGRDTVAAADGGDDSIVFELLSHGGVTASRNGDDLLLVYGDGDELTISGQFSGADWAVEQFVFADGSFTAAALIGV